MTPTPTSPLAPPAVTAWATADPRTAGTTLRPHLAPGAQLVSPLTDGFAFTGPDEVIGVVEAAFEVLGEIAVTAVTGADSDWVLWRSATLRGRTLEEIQWLHLDDDGRIDRITLFVRPVAAALDLLARIGAPLARRGLMHPRLAGGASLLAGLPAAQVGMAERHVMPLLRPGPAER